MGPGFPIFIVFVLVAIGIAIAVWAYQAAQEKQRTEQFKKLADELGFEFHPAGDGDFVESMKGHHLFSQGHSRNLWNLMRGKAGGLEVAVFDYKYVTGSGKHRHTWYHTVICMQFEGGELPTFSLRPETVWHKIGSWFGYRDIDFESHPEFSRRYLLRGSDEAAIRTLFTPEVLSFYEEQSGVSTEGAGNRLLFYRHSKRTAPENLRSVLEEGFKMLAVFRRER
jgi:hypothetical protein